MTYHHNTAADAEVPQIANSEHGSERAALSTVLTPDEIDLLGRYIGNNATQTQLAGQDNVAQTTVSYRVRRAVQKLNAAGMPVSLPGKGRRPQVPTTSIDPRAIGRLIGTGSDDGAGRPRMKWKDAKKTSYDETEQQ